MRIGYLVTLAPIVATLTNVAHGAPPPQIPFKSRELQEGKNYIQQLTPPLGIGESSGQVNYNFKIDVPPRHVTPALALQYSSSAGLSEFGWGWELTIPMIERAFDRATVVNGQFDTSSVYRFRNGHQSAELEPNGTLQGWSVYRERVEKTFNRYLELNGVWKILTPDGMTYDLGTKPESRRGENVLSTAGTAAWLVSRVSDTHQNYVEFTYQPDLAGNARIKWIRYAGNASGQAPLVTVEFVWATHWGTSVPAPVSFRSGYRRVFGQDHLDRVIVMAPAHATGSSPALIPAGSPTTRTYSFTYSAINGPDRVFQLVSAQVEAFPATTFEYAQTLPSGVVTKQAEFLPNDPSFPPDFGVTDTIGSTSKTKRVFVDVNSDGRPDLIDSTNCDFYVVWINSGTGFQRTVWPQLATKPGLPLPDGCSLRTTENGPADTITTQDYFDINGDGYPDIVWPVPSLGVFYCPGNGSGFDLCTNYGTTLPSSNFLRRETPLALDPNFSVTVTDLIDINGDGLVDSVTASGSNIVVRINMANSVEKFSPPLTFAAPSCSGLAFVGACLRLTQMVAGAPNRRIWTEIKDINGDGLPDFLTVDPTLPSTLHIGFGQVTTHAFNTTTLVGFAPLAATLNGPSLGSGNQNGTYLGVTDLADINGDGLPDSISIENGNNDVSLKVKLNLGGGAWDTTTLTYQLLKDAPPPLKSFFAAALSRLEPVAPPIGVDFRTAVLSQLSDINGDGMPDFVSAQIPGSTPSSLFARTFDYRVPRKLIVTRSLNGNVRSEASYTAINGTAPYPVHVAERMTRSRTPLYSGESSRTTGATTSYEYTQMGFDRQFRQVTSFGEVKATADAFATTTTTGYGTVYFLAGLVERRLVENRAAMGSVEHTMNSYVLENAANCAGCGWARLTETISLPSAQTNPGGFRTIRTQYLEYDSFGSPTRWVELGEPITPSDDIVHTRSFVSVETSFKLLHLPSVEQGASIVGGPLPTVRYYYDGQPLGAVPQYGSVTKVEREVTPGVFLSKSALFDAFGNMTQETDEMNAVSSFGYDQTYHYFRISATDPVGTTHKSFSGLTGQILDSCGPQYWGSSFRCSRSEVDSLGRATRMYVPTLVGSTYGKALLTQVSYNDVSYPLSTTVTKRGVSRSVEHRDGFGNPVELRVEETPGVFRVFESAYDAYARPLRTELERRESGSGYTHIAGVHEATTYTHDYVHDSIETVQYPREPGDTSPPATVTRVIGAGFATMLDEDHRLTTYNLDFYDRVAGIDQTGTGGPPSRTRFEYDTAGQITRVTDPDLATTTYGRNLLGWITTVIAPDNAATSYQYNGRGQPIASTDPRGVVLTNTYDSAGRLTRTLSSNEPAGVRRVDAQRGYYSVMASSQLGWLAGEKSDGITQAYVYSPDGAVIRHLGEMPGHSGLLAFEYNLGAQVANVTYPDGYRVNYAYNLDESVKTVTDNTGHVLASYEYEDDGQVSLVTNEFGLDEAFAYDVRGRRVSVASTNNAIIPGYLVDDTISYSKSSNVERIVRAGLKPGLIQRASPDVLVMNNDYLGRLQMVTLNDSHFGSYSHDLAGRIISFNEGTTAGSSTSTFAFDRLVRRDHGASSRLYAYDSAGNVTHDEVQLSGVATRVRDHSWDALGRYVKTQVQSGTQTEYYYTPTGAIARVVQPGELPNSADVIHVGAYARKDMSTGVWTDSVIVGGRLVGESTGPRFEMPHRTLQETVVAVSNDLGEVVRQEDYRAFGSRLSGTPTGRLEQHFHGLRVDEVMVAGGRAYDAEAGIWLGRDRLCLTVPEALVAAPRLSYMYVFNQGNPYVLRDPSGMDNGLIAGIIGPGTAAAADAIAGKSVSSLELIASGTDMVNTALNPFAAGDRAIASAGESLDAASQGEHIHAYVSMNEAQAHAQYGILLLTADIMLGRASRGAERAVTSSVHGNSKLSTRAQHGYEIKDTHTGEIVKTGISGPKDGGRTESGGSKRANRQANKWDRQAGQPGRYEPTVVYETPAGVGARVKALAWEAANAARLRAEGHLRDRTKHKRP